MTDEARPDGDRIAKLLARAGIASRREVERMIAEGRIARDGVTIDTPATMLKSLAGVTVDGQPVAAPAAARLFVFNKPPGLLVTERDPAGRRTIYDALPADLPRLVPVGRLDLATEGLLLLTTDGGLKRQLELPATGVERTYRARAYGEISQAQLEELIHGIEIEGVRYGSIDANLERRTGANVWIELTLTEGKNREVRRVLEYLGLQVSRLIRTRYGPFILGDLPVGEIGEVRQHELVAFRQTLGPKRAKGADLDMLVTVTPHEKPKPVAAPAAPVRASRPAPTRNDPARPAPPRPAAAKPTAAPARGGWGTRARPSRPTTSDDDRLDAPARRGRFTPTRTDDRAAAGRGTEERSGRPDRAAGRTGERATLSRTSSGRGVEERSGGRRTGRPDERSAPPRAPSGRGGDDRRGGRPAGGPGDRPGGPRPPSGRGPRRGR